MNEIESALADEGLSMEERGLVILDAVARIRVLREQQDRLFRQLEDIAELWAKGIDPKDVSRLGYYYREDRGFPGPLEDKEARKRRFDMRIHGIVYGDACPAYTHVILKDGTKIVFSEAMIRHSYGRIRSEQEKERGNDD